ncbi:MAG: hypothetical protein ABIP77_02945 [Candidatus Limnocylindrales bacterium]
MRGRGAIATVLVTFLAIGCSGLFGSPAPRGATDEGFLLGAVAKDLEHPVFGRFRLIWIFAGDGRWAEVPVALDGQTIRIPAVRGTFVLDGQKLTLTPDFPPGLAPSDHAWRVEDDTLRTTFASGAPEDEDWFRSVVDGAPWRRVE